MVKPACLLLVIVCTALGCRTQRFSEIDLSVPGWDVRRAQAVWTPGRTKPEITGDLVIAKHEVGGAYLQFSKTIPIVSARTDGDAWELEVASPHHRYGGHGKPPWLIVWFELLEVLAGNDVREPWHIVEKSTALVSIENTKTGERLEVHF